MRVFRDRREAGRQLVRRLGAYVGRADVVVLGLPRGGVPVAYEVAIGLGAPLDVLVVRKLGVPGHEELAMGAIASGGIQVVEHRVVDALGISRETFERVEHAARHEVERRERAFRDDRQPLDVRGKTVILVDDGLATGSSMAAAIEAIRTRSPARLICGVPVAPPETCEALGLRTDEMICLLTPERMYAIGVWYEDFSQTTDTEVRQLLDAAREPRVTSPEREERVRQ